jgi:hypothetical protein
MSLAVANIKKRQTGGVFFAAFEVTPSGNYVTGGEVLSPTLESMHHGGKSPDFVKVDGKAGFVFQYDHANKKLLTYCNTAGASNSALGEHTAVAYVSGITGVAHKGVAVWLT